MTAIKEKACNACIWQAKCKIYNYMTKLKYPFDINFDKWGCNRWEKGELDEKKPASDTADNLHPGEDG